MILNILLLPMLFFIGLITVYDDFKCGKVRNKWIALGLAWGLGIILLFLIWYFVAEPITRFFYFKILNYPSDYEVVVFTVNLAYLLKSILNILLALIIGFLMWKFNVWAAGDAKLFMVYSALLPMTFYWKSFFSIFPSFVLMINIFIPIFIYLLFSSFLYFLKYTYQRLKGGIPAEAPKKKKLSPTEKIKAILNNFKQMSIMMVAFIGIFLTIKLSQAPLEKYLPIDVFSLQVFIFAAIIIFAGSVMEFVIRPLVSKLIFVLVALLVGYGLIYAYQATLETLYLTLVMLTIFIIVLSIFRKLINFHVLRADVRRIKIEKIKPRMSLTEDIAEEIKKDKEFYKAQIGQFYPGGLLTEQVGPIKQWLRQNKKGVESVQIYTPFPFVVWMFLGVVITIVLKGSLFHLIWRGFF